MTRRAELEAAIETNPYDRKQYAVLADHLQELGDPRGELMRSSWQSRRSRPRTARRS